MFYRDITQPFELRATTYLPLNGMLCVIKIKILLSAYYKRGTVNQLDICHLTFFFYSHSSLEVNKAADLSRLVFYTFLWRSAGY